MVKLRSQDGETKGKETDEGEPMESRVSKLEEMLAEQNRVSSEQYKSMTKQFAEMCEIMRRSACSKMVEEMSTLDRGTPTSSKVKENRSGSFDHFKDDRRFGGQFREGDRQTYGRSAELLDLRFRDYLMSRNDDDDETWTWTEHYSVMADETDLLEEETMPQSKVPIANSEIMKSIELENVDLGLEKLEYVVPNENLEQELDQKNVTRKLEVYGDVERSQKVMSDTKIFFAHQLFDQKPVRVTHKEKQMKHLKAWKFKFKSTSKRSKLMDDKFSFVDATVLLNKDLQEMSCFLSEKSLVEFVGYKAHGRELLIVGVKQLTLAATKFYLKHKWRSRPSHSFSEMKQRMIWRVWKSSGYLMVDMIEEGQKLQGDSEPLMTVPDFAARICETFFPYMEVDTSEVEHKTESGGRADDDDETSRSFQIDYSFATEYKGPLIANVPRALPVEVDQIPTAHPVSFSSLSNDISYPVAQPLVRTKNRVTKKPPESGSDKKKKNGLLDSAATATATVVLKGRDVVSGSSSSSSKRLDVSEEAKSSVDLPLSPSSASSEAVREEDTLDDGIASSDVGSGIEDCSIGEETDGEHVNRVKFVEPIQDSECDESSYISDGDSIAATPKAERKGKRGSCYRCLMGNRFTEKEVCIVCDAKYCFNCVRRAMGAMPEGRKCQTCIGYRIDESKRGSLGKCSRMLKRVLTDLELRQVMSDEISCKANQLPSRLITVNEKPLSEDELFMLQTCPNPPKKLKPGNYWYDKVAGYWGKLGEKPCQIISPQMNVGGSSIKQNASNGDTEILINNREITRTELMMLKMVGVQCEGKPHFWVDSTGTYQEEGQRRTIGNIWNKKRTKLACAVLSLPLPPASSAVEPSDVPLYEQKMLSKLLLIGNEKCGATTIYKQARSLYNVPFSEDDRERIKFIIQTNLYNYLAMVLEAHEKFEEEMSNNQSSDQTGNTGDETSAKTVSSISPRLKHFSDWLLKEKEEGNLKIFPTSSRENAQTVADLWRVPAIQATYKRLRDTLPRNAVYFLGRILEISRSEYDPSDMDILQAEGLSSMEGLSCVEFSFPSTSQEESLESDYKHDPNMKYQLIRLNPRSLGENWKWLEMFEDAVLVIFCVSLTDYGEYVEDCDGVRVNKMIANKQLFENMVTHPSLANKRFLLVLTKFDLLEEKIEEVPLRSCEWFEDFNPLISQNQTSRHNPPMAQRAFHYIGYEFKRLYDTLMEPISMRGRSFRPKLFVSQVSLESDTVDNALRYAREILKWHVEETSMFQEMSTTSIEASLSS